MQSRLVLASGSPRRRDLLGEAGFDFEVVVPLIAESTTRALTVIELARYNAMRKATAVARTRRGVVVLGADTLVSLESEPIGKPRSLVEAAEILARLSGREHHVCTAVSVIAPGRVTSFHVVSHVCFHSFTAEQITAYIVKINPLDKAGAYAAQGDGVEIIARITGSFSNVVGLPMDETIRALRRFGIRPRSTR